MIELLVLSQGKITGEFDRKDATQEKILKFAVEIKEFIEYSQGSNSMII